MGPSTAKEGCGRRFASRALARRLAPTWISFAKASNKGAEAGDDVAGETAGGVVGEAIDEVMLMSVSGAWTREDNREWKSGAGDGK